MITPLLKNMLPNFSLPHEEFTEMCEAHKLNKQQIDLARQVIHISLIVVVYPWRNSRIFVSGNNFLRSKLIWPGTTVYVCSKKSRIPSVQIFLLYVNVRK